MTKQRMRINRNGNTSPANAQAPTRRDVLEKAGQSFLVIIAGGFVSNASTVGQVENAAPTDSPKMSTTNEPTLSEHQQEPTASEVDSFWYARDIMGLID